MESDIELAVRHASDLARARGRDLASITLRGTGPAAAVYACTEAVLHRLGLHCPEINFEDGGGPLRLASVEFHP